MNDIFFCHPGKENEIKNRIIDDIRSTKSRILCAMAFFTDKDFECEIIDSCAEDKRIILNNADFQRDDNQVARDVFYRLNCMRLGTYYEGDKMGSHMHNKILICDNIAWVGSYNFTHQASKRNWENMLRIDELSIVDKIVYEFESMWFYSQVIEDKLQGARCKECGKIVTDPMKHYAVFINTSFVINGYFEDDAISTLCLDVHDKEERLEKCASCGKLVPSSQIVIMDDSSSFEGVCGKCAIEEMKWLHRVDEDFLD